MTQGLIIAHTLNNEAEEEEVLDELVQDNGSQYSQEDAAESPRPAPKLKLKGVDRTLSHHSPEDKDTWRADDEPAPSL